MVDGRHGLNKVSVQSSAATVHRLLSEHVLILPLSTEGFRVWELREIKSYVKLQLVKVYITAFL